MSTVDGRSGESGRTASSKPVDLKLEAVVIPVADADRSKASYGDLGWRLDADFSFDNGFPLVHFTPPASLEDPDGNSWLLQVAIDRLPGWLDPTITSFNSAGDLAGDLRGAKTAHGEHEMRTGKADPDWPDWYAEDTVREQKGQELPL